MISGDKVKMEVDFATNMGLNTSIQEFLILENDAELLVMGVQWHRSSVGEHSGEPIRLVNIETFGKKNRKFLWTQLKKKLRKTNYSMIRVSRYL